MRATAALAAERAGWYVVTVLAKIAAAGWLQWSAPAQCPDAASVQAAIEDRLGRSVEPDEIEVRAQVVDDGAAGYRLSLVTSSASGEDRRELTAHDCRALADATSLLVAITIDAVAVARSLETDATVDAEVVAPERDAPADLPAPVLEPAAPRGEAATLDERGPAASTATIDRVRPTGPARRTIPEVAGSIAGGVMLGTLPGVSGGPELGLAILWRRVRLEVAGTWMAPRTERSGDASVRVQLGVATARACVRLGTVRVEVPTCGGIELGAMRGDGRGAPAARTAHGAWVAPVIAAGVRGWVTPRLSPFVRLDVAIPVAHPAFELRGADERVELYRASPASGRLFLGLEVKFSTPRDGWRASRRTSKVGP